MHSDQRQGIKGNEGWNVRQRNPRLTPQDAFLALLERLVRKLRLLLQFHTVPSNQHCQDSYGFCFGEPSNKVMGSVKPYSIKGFGLKLSPASNARTST